MKECVNTPPPSSQENKVKTVCSVTLQHWTTFTECEQALKGLRVDFYWMYQLSNTWSVASISLSSITKEKKGVAAPSFDGGSPLQHLTMNGKFTHSCTIYTGPFFFFFFSSFLDCTNFSDLLAGKEKSAFWNRTIIITIFNYTVFPYPCVPIMYF